MKNYYEILEVSESATVDEIQRSYKRLMMRWHPDRATAEDRPLAEEKAKELNEAKEILLDPGKREAYERTRSMGFQESYYQNLFRYYNADINIEDDIEIFGFIASLFQQFTDGGEAIPTRESFRFRVWKPFYNEKVLRLIISFSGGIGINDYSVVNRFWTKEIILSTTMILPPEQLRLRLRKIPTLKFIDP